MSVKAIFAGLVALVLALPVLGATVEDRSPFRQGHWWDPTRSGHGFEVLNSGGQVFVVWYTYDEGGRPTWFTAQGSQATMGSIWPLQKHRWSEGRIAESTNVGILRLSVNHFESMAASWQIGATQGTWALEPFVQSGSINEVDLTGHWFDPTHSGWGMTLVDQGDVFGAVIYAYDAAGAPTWVAGFDRGKGTRIDLHWTRGSCPSCEYRTVGTQPAGTIDIAYRGDTEVTVRGALTVALAQGLQIDGARVQQLGRPASTRRADYQLASFAREDTLKAFLVAGMDQRILGGGSDFSAAPPSSPVSFSTTNVQEAGVDEADVVKSDGRYVYALSPLVYSGMPYTQPARKVRIAALGEGGSAVEPVGEFPLATGTNSWSVDAGLYVHAGNLVTLASAYYYGGWYYSPAPAAETYIEVLSLANPSAPASRWRARLSGTLVSSRRIGDRLYVVSRFTPSVPGYTSYAWTEEQRAANRALLAAAPLASLLPSISVDGAPAQALVAPASIYAPQLGGSRPLADMVVVTVFDLREPRLVDGLAIVGRTEVMYVSPGAIYLATSRYETRAASGALRPLQPSLFNTDIHQIRIQASGMSLVGTGSIEGWVGYGDKAAFRFGEFRGKLGVVSSSTTGWWGSNSNRVTILEPSATAPGLLKTVSYLPNGRRPQALGKPGEALYGTRFVGDKLFAVTFRQVDPLYAVDLADPSDPRITGELEVPGFSDYLHPLSSGLLLGFGRDATAAGWMQGLHMTLFDVSGAVPREIQRVSLGKRGSDSALFGSHHAFSALARPDGSTIVSFPAAINDGTPSYGSGDTAYYPWQYSGLLRFEVRGTTAADAHIERMPTLVTARAADASSYAPAPERTWGMGRAVLFPSASIYVRDGEFWRIDDAGTTFGPY